MALPPAVTAFTSRSPVAEAKKVSIQEYERVRAMLMEQLCQFTDPETGGRVVTQVWTREEAFPGTQMDMAPDLTLSLRDGALCRSSSRMWS